MKKIVLTLTALMAFSAFAMTAEDIMAQVDSQLEPETMKADMTMVLVDSKGKKTRSIHAKYFD
jgi:outer membrane lipoprotein-sorting protein